jgi:hypothetical protein
MELCDFQGLKSYKDMFPPRQAVNVSLPHTFAFGIVILLFQKGVKKRLKVMSSIRKKYQNVYPYLLRESHKIESLCYLGFNPRFKKNLKYQRQMICDSYSIYSTPDDFNKSEDSSISC